MQTIDNEARLSNLKSVDNSRRFVVTRMGYTGSTWLAKLLNSHPDVYCSHEGVVAQVYPRKDFTEGDIVNFIEHLAWDPKGGAYEAVGDVGSVWTNHVLCLQAFSTALLVRHPARILYGRLAIYPKNQFLAKFPPESQIFIREKWGINAQRYEPLDQMFLHDAAIFAGQVALLDTGVQVIRIEDMHNTTRCQQALHTLTGVGYDATIVEAAKLKRVNCKSGGPERISEIVANFTPLQRSWYKAILSNAASSFHYDLMGDTE